MIVWCLIKVALCLIVLIFSLFTLILFPSVVISCHFEVVCITVTFKQQMLRATSYGLLPSPVSARPLHESIHVYRHLHAHPLCAAQPFSLTPQLGDSRWSP